MLRKHFIVTSLILAYVIVLGHSIIPHHHHDHHQLTEKNHKSHHDHEDNDHEDGDLGLSHDFASFFHSGNTTEFHQPTDKITFHPLETVYVAALFEYTIKEVAESPPPLTGNASPIPLLLRCLSAKGLRAPPSLMS